MRNKYVQMSLYDTYKSVAASMEDDKPKLFRLLDEHIDWDTLIPARFYLAFYRNTGRPRKYPLAAFLKGLVLQKIFGYVNDSVLLATLRHSREMRKFCGFQKVPDAAKLTRFKRDFLPYIMEVFERLVELTEPICREMDAELGDSLIYDTTGVESCVAENNPKYFSSKFRQAKSLVKLNPATVAYISSKYLSTTKPAPQQQQQQQTSKPSGGGTQSKPSGTQQQQPQQPSEPQGGGGDSAADIEARKQAFLNGMDQMFKDHGYGEGSVDHNWTEEEKQALINSVGGVVGG